MSLNLKLEFKTLIRCLPMRTWVRSAFCSYLSGSIARAQVEQLTESLLSSERRLTSVRLENEGLKSRVALGDTRVADLLAKIDALEKELAQYRARGGANGFGHPMRALPGVRVAAVLGDTAAALPMASRIAAAMSSTPSSSAASSAVAGGRAGGVRASRSSSAVREAGDGRGTVSVTGAANGFQPSGQAADPRQQLARSVDRQGARG